MADTNGWSYDHTKDMYYRHKSTCHQASLKQKMLYKGKIITDPNFKIVTTNKDNTTSVKDVRFRYYCTKCNKQNEGKFETQLKGGKHE